MASAAASSERVLTVRVGDKRFALPASLVGEITRLPRISRVPNAPQGLIGLANVRGAVIPVLSLAKLLLQDDDDSGSSRLVMIDAGEPVGLAVDDVRQLADGEASAARIDVAELVARCIPRRDKVSVQRRAVAAEPNEASERIALVAFDIADQHFALPLTSVDEVVRLPANIALLPQADTAVIGSAVLRDATLPLLSLSALLALPSRPGDGQSRVVVARIGQHRVGLAVDAMQSILWVDPADIDPVPHLLSRGNAEAKIQAICRLDGGTRLISVLSADQLLRDDITHRLLQDSAREGEIMNSSTSRQMSEQFLVFRIGEDEFGLPVAAVEEIVPMPSKLSRLPKSPAFVQGALNLRGEVIPVIDQVRRFDGIAATGHKRRVVVVRMGDLRAGFIVDAVSEVLRVDASDLQAAPNLEAEGTRVFERVANLHVAGRLILIVSPHELLDRAEKDWLLAVAAKVQ